MVRWPRSTRTSSPNPVGSERSQALRLVAGVDDLDSQRGGARAITTYADRAVGDGASGRSRLIRAEHRDQTTLTGGRTERECELLLKLRVSADLLPEVRDALPHLVEPVGTPGAAARQYLIEVIAVEEREHRR